jgi:hypothetical protein
MYRSRWTAESGPYDAEVDVPHGHAPAQGTVDIGEDGHGTAAPDVDAPLLCTCVGVGVWLDI